MAHRGVHLAPYASVLTVGRDFLIWWDFIDGLYLSKGVDLIEVFQEVNAIRAFNVIDALLIEEALRDGKVEGQIEKIRTAILGVYNSNSAEETSLYTEEELNNMEGTRSDPSRPAKAYIPTVEPTDAGYPGMLPPLN